MASSSRNDRSMDYCDVEEVLPRRTKVIVDNEVVIKGGVKKKTRNIVVESIRVNKEVASGSMKKIPQRQHSDEGE